MNSREDFDKIANEIFFPIYEVIAQEALGVLGRKNGVCLDVGCGGGHLGLSVAKASDMRITLMDVKEDAIIIAKNRIKEWELEGRTSTIVSDVREINLPDNSFDLITSRGSIGFWGSRDEMKQAFAEIYRVLAPNGMTFIGKGFGSAELKAKITAQMKVLHPEWPQCVIDASNGFGVEDYADFLKELRIPAKIINDDRGIWIMMKKTA
ncbi:methyltransferase, UbiE/COQ5 family [Desulfosporosinus sp. BG]|nr:methyltransferase, UbiE/COQ5 family [Desulfosporosinus sp. BG]